jgi:F-box protein 11
MPEPVPAMRAGTTLLSPRGEHAIVRCRLAGVEVRESGNPKIHRNKIYGHETSGGIYIHHHGRGDLEKNDVYNNSLSGIVVWQSGKPICKQNRVSKNGEFGIHVRDGGWGTYEDNDLRSNARGGILVNADCKLKVIESRNLID